MRFADLVLNIASEIPRKENPSLKEGKSKREEAKIQALSFRESSLFKGLRRPLARKPKRVHAAPLSNLQDAWKEIKIRRKEIKTHWNKIKVQRDWNPNPAERNPNLTSFHESSLFNGLSPTLTGSPLKCLFCRPPRGRDAHSLRPGRTVNNRFTRSSRKCRFFRKHRGATWAPRRITVGPQDRSTETQRLPQTLRWFKS